MSFEELFRENGMISIFVKAVRLFLHLRMMAINLLRKNITFQNWMINCLNH